MPKGSLRLVMDAFFMVVWGELAAEQRPANASLISPPARQLGN